MVFDPNYVDSHSPPIKIDGVTTHYHVDTFVDSINHAIAVCNTTKSLPVTRRGDKLSTDC